MTAAIDRLFTPPLPAAGPRQLADRRDSLPDPVRRYLDFAAPGRPPEVATVHLRHGGEFRPKPGRWYPIAGEEYFTAARPGFVWSGAIRMAPFVRVRAVDSLIAGQGNMLVKLNSLFKLADARGRETNQSALVRWLMECVWFPYGFLGDQVLWEPVDARSARAILAGAELPVSILAEFGEDGAVVRVSGERYRDAGGGKSALTLWIGRCSQYREFHGFRIPAFIQGSWAPPEGEFPYVHFRVEAVEYNGGTA